LIIGGLNLLPRKRWNVYNLENREKVRKDNKLLRCTDANVFIKFYFFLYFKIILKIKKYYFNIFLNKKYFKKLIYSQTLSPAS